MKSYAAPFRPGRSFFFTRESHSKATFWRLYRKVGDLWFSVLVAVSDYEIAINRDFAANRIASARKALREIQR